MRAQIINSHIILVDDEKPIEKRVKQDGKFFWNIGKYFFSSNISNYIYLNKFS